MKKSIYKRALAAAVSLMMAVSVSACGQKDDSPSDGEPMTAPTETSVTVEQTDSVNDDDGGYFGEGYDPFDDSYDPYAGGAAVTDVQTSVALRSDDDDAPVGTKASQAQTAAQTAAQTTAAVTEAAQKDTKPAETTAAKKSDGDKSAARADAELIISVPNGWNDGTSDFSQVDGTVRNNGKTNIESWTATIKVGSNASIEQSWNCGLDLKNGTITVTPVDYNTTITPGGEGTFGFILKNPGKIDPDQSELKCTAGTYSATNGNYSGDGTPPGAPVYAKDVPEPTTDDWLSVKGNKIVDKNGKEVWITGVNWFGYNTGTNTFDGLWACDLNTSLASIADHGFNLLRVPISAELINSWAAGNYPTANFNQATNSYLVGMNSLEIFDYVIGQCRANGLKIMIDIHSAKTDAMGHMKNMWYEGSVTEADYLAALSWMAERYKNDDTIIAYDLKNEPHGKANENPRAKWDGSKDSDNWKYVAEKAANAVLSKNPNVLVMVEGIEIYPVDIKKNGDFSSTSPSDYYSTWWGGNLRGVKDNPIDLGKYQNKLVYSPHDYGPAVYQQEWFKGDYTYESLYKDAWHDNWLYIQEDGTAPLLIGEWGGFMTQPNLKWMTYLRQLIKEKKINHTFWCFNANSGDTGGLVKDDFVTWDNEKYEFVKEVLWQENGKFVGLDHEIPLGSNGKTLS